MHGQGQRMVPRLPRLRPRPQVLDPPLDRYLPQLGLLELVLALADAAVEVDDPWAPMGFHGNPVLFIVRTVGLVLSGHLAGT